MKRELKEYATFGYWEEERASHTIPMKRELKDTS